MDPVLGIENPLVDFVGHVGEEAMRGLPVEPGTMNLVDEQTMKRVLSVLPSCDTLPGGSCANTIRGIAWLRGSSKAQQTMFSGAVGDDELGRTFESGLLSAGVRPLLARKGTRTGVSVILVTPDHERTMCTYLGACREYGQEDLPRAELEQARLLHLTGYLWDTEPQKAAAAEAVRAARRRGAAVSFDVADPFVVSRYRDEFLAWIPGNVDVLFANRAELAGLVGSRAEAGDPAAAEAADRAILDAAAALAPTVVMKVGKDGSWCLDRGVVSRSPACRAVVVDTTGAGDAFAAGFLFAVSEGRSAEEASRLANRVAAAVVGVEGCRYDGVERGG